LLQFTLPDKTLLELPDHSTGLETVQKIGEGLARAALAVKVDGVEYDLSRELENSGSLEVITTKSPEGLEVIRHSTAHLMAMAITELYPDTKLAIGPVIENGFYYDLESSHTFTPDDFSKIEKKMTELAKADLPVKREVVNRLEAIEKYKQEGEKYKVDLMESWEYDTVSLYHQGDWHDLCTGPHVPSTGKLGHFKLLSVAGAYWRGDTDQPMLQRIYATAFPDKKALKQHLHLLEEAKKRDHRLIGKEMDLFHMDEDSPGMVFWHPRGWKLYRNLTQYVSQKLERNGYQEVHTPEIVDSSLFQKSGHMDKYSEMIFQIPTEKKNMAIKPMNCPCHVEVFKQGIKSHKDLPYRLAEFGKCHRNELAGTMHGLMRVRGFTQDDGHIFCTQEQVSGEVAAFCNLVKEIYADFGFHDIEVKFSDRPEKRLGDDATWDQSEQALRDACEAAGLEYTLNPGEGAFYGPKLEFTLKDCIGRSWQCGTIQVDFQLPERLGAVYIDSQSNRVAPVMLHRAALGSFERFMGILIENYAGDFPLWLHPDPLRILPISAKFESYCLSLQETLQAAGFSCTVDNSNEKIGKKIRDGEKDKVPYLLVVGAKEAEEGTVSLRKRKVGDQGVFSIDEIVKKLTFERENKGVPSEELA
jgi:threonyl-tRNA synthetase